MVYSVISDSIGTTNQFIRRKKIHINSSSDGALTDYQVLYSITYDNNMQSEFGDISFTEINGTYIPHYITSYVIETSASVHLKIDVPASNGKDIYMYYGNPIISNTNDGDNTYIFFDDFGVITNQWNRYSGNPVFAKNPTNPSWDYFFVNSPFLAVDEDGDPYKDGSGRYYMYYSGSGNADGYVFNEDQVGLARSTDLINWTRVTSTVTPLGSAHDGLVLPLGANGQFDDADTQIGTIIVKDGTFHMWYTGNDNSSSDNLKFGYATSSDGITWTKSGSNPIMSYGSVDDNDGIYAPHVILDGSTWKMWYIGKNTVGSPSFGVMYATAPLATPTVWTRYSNNYVYEHNQTGNSMWGSYVYKDGSTYYMIYINYTTLPYEFHYATSSDGISWNYQGLIFKVGETGEWDAKLLAWVSQIQVGSTWYTFYRGDDASDEIKIGFCTSANRLPIPASTTLDTSKWTKTEVGTGTITQAGEQLTAYSGGSGNRAYVDSDTDISNGVIIEGNAKIPVTTAYCEFGLGQWYGDADDNRIVFIDASTANSNWYLGSTNAGTSGTLTQVTGDADYHDFKIIYESDQIRWYIDGDLKKTETNSAYIPAVSMPISFGSQYSNATGSAYIKYVSVRKYTDNPPTTSTGNEKHQRRIPQFIG